MTDSNTTILEKAIKYVEGEIAEIEWKKSQNLETFLDGEHIYIEVLKILQGESE